MDDIIEWIIPRNILIMGLFVGAIFGLAKYLEVILGYNFITHFFKKRREKVEQKPEKIKVDFFKVVSELEFVQWRTNVIHRIYGPEAIARIAKVDYPIKCIEASPKTAQYPFENLTLNKLLSTEVGDEYMNLSGIESEYWNVITPQIFGGGLFGYAIDNIILDVEGKIESLKAFTCNYKQTVVSCHILEYELYKYYVEKKSASLFGPIVHFDMLQRLSLRKRIHTNQTLEEIVHRGKNRKALLGVQALFVSKMQIGDKEEYRIRLIQRSNANAIRNKYWQFVPSGGFEVFEADASDFDIEEDFDVSLSVLRELLEEVHGVKELQHFEGKTCREIIAGYWEANELKRLQKNGKAHILFLGTIFDFLILRHELSFLIMVDEPEFTKEFEKRIDAGRKLEEGNKDKRTFDEGRVRGLNLMDLLKLLRHDKTIMNPASAGLLKLAFQNDTFRTRLVNEEGYNELLELVG